MDIEQKKKRTTSLQAAHRGALIALLLVGVFGTLVVLRLSWYSELVSLYNRALTIAATMDESTITTLRGDSSDLKNPKYVELKSFLKIIRSVNTDMRFIYLFGQKSGDIFFYVDSEDSTSADYSPPGDMYPEGTQEFKNIFITGAPFTEGPKRDRWGTWVSGVAPIKDAQGNVIAGLGIDVDARMFYANILLDAGIPALLTLVMLIVAYAGTRLRRKEKEIISSRINVGSLVTEYVRMPLVDILPKLEDIASRENITPSQEEILRGIHTELTTSIEGIDGVLASLKHGRHSKHFPRKD